MVTATHPTRDELVRRWRDIVHRLELAGGDERAALIRELRQVEAEAMRLIEREHEEAAR